ncbi:diguanylate cyclase (GGDEF)-like protein/PAS domain S-box-containing protein [Anoxybacillus tepidamans]|uniref:Diguanylate cyclase (GGDEF)-like protein/PAS domain S-box-containing protein n=1 Tax=Anoxybacteroides tepidamans TaxID=265948 RepID=A0A7W8IM67_9BACL|nr:EAL domain-containing protein [Anoxybacillus tepidamans]MBB5323060.1 diguanylate cyclase (GGDEF)-like protein/PAS domain S-box-containing protein [Anoxybacillus tepidamans]
MGNDCSKLLQQTIFINIANKVMKHINEGIMVTDREGSIIWVNPAFEIVTGYHQEEIIGQNPRFLQSGLHDKAFYKSMWKEIIENGVWKGEIWNKRKDGELFLEWLTVISIRDRKGNITNYLAIFSDITVQKRNIEQLKKLAHYDMLTGVPNRYLFTKRLEDLIETSHRHRQLFAVMFLDLDRFKYVNDTLGHHAGDSLLQKVAQRLKGILQKKDTLARFGGDEFVIILPNLKHIREAARIAKTIIDVLKAPFSIEGQDIYVTASIGVSFYPHNGENVEVLIRNADRAMHSAKKKGKNRFELYNSHEHGRDEQDLVLENDLHKALECGELLLYYQPQLDLRTNQISGVEALVRWKHPERGLVSPVAFIPLAEETGLIIPMSEWVLEEACRQLKQLHLAYPKLKMSVNISAVHFLQNELVETIDRILQKTAVDPRYLELELTESTLMPNAPFAIEWLVQMKQRQIKIAIDDFGTGFSSLSYLHRFPIDTLKIDKSFIRHLSSYRGEASIVKAIIEMGRSLNVSVVAEGVETEKQYKFLKEQRCDYAQGYYISKPLLFDELQQFLREWNTE